MSEEEQKYFKGLIGFTFDSDDIRYIEKIVDKKDKEIERLNNKVEELMTLYTTERNVKEDYKAIINELEKWIEKNKQLQLFSERCIVWEDKLTEKINELKGDSSNGDK